MTDAYKTSQFITDKKWAERNKQQFFKCLLLYKSLCLKTTGNNLIKNEWKSSSVRRLQYTSFFTHPQDCPVEFAYEI